MSAKKKTATTVDAVERRPHRYPTRFKLRQDMTMTTTDAVEKLPRDLKLRRNTPYLPTEVIFNILIFVPAKVLFDAARYACKQWYDIVSDPDFITAHCRLSNPGFVIEDSIWPHSHMIHIEADTPNTTEIQIPFGATVKSCFNGLVLLLTSSNIFHVVNPVTKENISLPPLEGELSMSESKAGLAVDSRGHYKVVFAPYQSDCDEHIPMSLFTIGVDKAWRFIDFENIPVNSEVWDAMSYSPQVFGGFMCWFTYNYHCVPCRSSGFALDIDTETIYQVSLPNDIVGDRVSATFISMGTSLGFMLNEGCIWRLWKLTDVKSGEWTVLPHINVSTLRTHFDEVFGRYVNLIYHPVKLVRGDLWLYRKIKDKSLVIRFNFVNENMVVFPIKKRELSRRILLPHVNTLVSPKNF